MGIAVAQLSLVSCEKEQDVECSSCQHCGSVATLGRSRLFAGEWGGGGADLGSPSSSTEAPRTAFLPLIGRSASEHASSSRREGLFRWTPGRRQ